MEMGVVVGIVAALCTPVIALLFRRGPVFRAFGIELVTADGHRVARGHVVVRQLIVCVPMFFACYLTWGALVDLSPSLKPTGLSGYIVLFLVPSIWGLITVAAVRTPIQSVADHLAHTYLVPEG
jgi:hypothetical protein